MLGYFFDGLEIPKSPAEAKLLFAHIYSSVCSGPTVEEPSEEEKTLASCIGTQLRIDLQPLTCSIHSEEKKVECVPPQIIMTQLPGYCEKVFKPSVTYIGKSCQLVKRFGKAVEKVFPAEHEWHKIIKPGVDLTEEVVESK